MDFKIDKDELQSAIDVFGVDAQFGMLQEECAELIVAVNKRRRGSDGYYENLIEEIGDTIILLEQVLIYLNDNERIQAAIDAKMVRVRQRIAKHDLNAKADFIVNHHVPDNNR